MRRRVGAGILATLLLVLLQRPSGPVRSPGRDAAPQALARPLQCQPAIPSTCGQLRDAGAGFFDQHGPWIMHGVQFFLPQYGINGRSFWDFEYHQATQDGSLDYWLDRAEQSLHANMLRIFVDLPSERAGTLSVPTGYPTLFDFATRANARGMRLGISIHNNDDWDLTAGRQQWIEGLLSYLLERDALPMIAYLNLDNEINNYCDPRHAIDCFASADSPHIERALDWIRRARSAIKARAPQMLVTVGMSTELADTAGRGGVGNYFLADSHGDTIAALTDFLAPHNYGGRGMAIIKDIRERGYRGPVVLEEYGFPTDPFPGSTHWSEGPAQCRIDPLAPPCFETAPFYVETNLNALRQADYAGGAAWMLADIQEKELPTACDGRSIPSDLWTGLFAVGSQYCAGGTRTRTPGSPKATATRVCFYHTNNLDLCLQGLEGAIHP